MSDPDGVADSNDDYFVAFFGSFQNDIFDSFNDWVNCVINFFTHWRNGITYVFFDYYSIDGNLIFCQLCFNLELIYAWSTDCCADAFRHFADRFAFQLQACINHDNHSNFAFIFLDNSFNCIARFADVAAWTFSFYD